MADTIIFVRLEFQDGRRPRGISKKPIDIRYGLKRIVKRYIPRPLTEKQVEGATISSYSDSKEIEITCSLDYALSKIRPSQVYFITFIVKENVEAPLSPGMEMAIKQRNFDQLAEIFQLNIDLIRSLFAYFEENQISLKRFDLDRLKGLGDDLLEVVKMVFYNNFKRTGRSSPRIETDTISFHPDNRNRCCHTKHQT